jgi:hypothetical protein
MAQRVSWFPLVAFVALALMLALGASAEAGSLHSNTIPLVTCTDTWTNPAGGAWTVGANWSTGSPPTAAQNACITLDGTYTVQLVSAAVTVRSLTFGGTTGTQLLQIADDCLADGALTVTATSTIGATAQVELTDAATCAGNATLAGPVTNNGLLVTDPGVGGNRHLQGTLTNTPLGTVRLNTTTSLDGTSPNLKNSGTVSLADGVTLNVPSGSTFTHTAGTLSSSSNPSAGQVVVQGGTFSEGNGTVSGTKPVIVDDGTLSYTGSGASSLAVHGTSTVGGKLMAGQALSLESTCAENALVSGTSTFTSTAGTVTLSTADSCTNNVTLSWSGTLTNSGTVNVQPASGGSRTLQGNLTNKGNLFVNTPLAANASGTVLDNFGTITIADGTALNLTNGASFNSDTGGLVTTNASGQLSQIGGTFTQGGGGTSGTKPVVLDDLTLNYTGTGNSNLWLHGASIFSGAITSKQLLTIESTCAENAVATANGVTNGGNVTLTNADSCPGNATLSSPAGVLTNTGTLVTQPASGGARLILGNLINSGLLSIFAATSYTSAGTTLTNQGLFNVADGAVFTAGAGTTLLNTTGGLITPNNTGLLLVQGGTFSQGAGQGNGVKPVVVDDGTLTYTGTGGINIGIRGASTLNGNVAAGQTLSIESTCAENAAVTAPQSVVMGGTLVFTNADSCPNNATLTLTTGSLTNRGTLETVVGVGGTRLLQAPLVNQKTVILDVGSLLQLGKTFSQTSAGTLQSNVASATSFGALNVTGSASLGGILAPAFLGGYVPTLGSSLPILTASSVTGAFASVTGGSLNTKGLYLQPGYGSKGVNLTVTQATLAVNPKQGLPGISVAVSGTSWTANDVLTVTFNDSGVVTNYPNATGDSTGAFSTNVTIPANAAVANGRITVTSTITGANLFVTFKVT